MSKRKLEALSKPCNDFQTRCHKSEIAKIHFISVEKLMQQSKWSEALRTCNSLLELSPTCERMGQYKAQTLFHMNHFDDSCAAYDTVFKKLGKLFESNKVKNALIEGKADALFNGNYFKQAEEVYRVLGSNPNILKKRAKALSRIHDFDEALKIYSQLSEVNPYDATVHKKIGDIYSKINKPLVALDYYTKAIQLNPYYLKARYSKAKLTQKNSYFNVSVIP